MVPGRQTNPYSYLAARDYAEIVSGLFSSDGARGATVTVLGPERYTMREALEVYRDVARPGLKVGEVPLPLLKLVSTATRNAELGYVVTLFQGFQRLSEEGGPDGPDPSRFRQGPMTTLRQWCEDEGRRLKEAA